MPARDEALQERAAMVARLRTSMPAAMRDRAQWLLWKSEQIPRREGWQKVPYYANGSKRMGALGGAEDLAKLVTLEVALQRVAQSLTFTGVGFAFVFGDGLIGIDLDKMVDADTGEMREHQLAAIEACASYTERSPSGKGVHIIVAGECDSFKHDACGVEVYCGGRYFTCTGDRWDGTPAEVAPIKPYALAYLRDVVVRSKSDAAAARAEEAAAAREKKGEGAAPPVSLRPALRGTQRDDFRAVNDAAMRDLAAWVPQVLPSARAARSGYRISSKALGRELQEDLSLMPEGIMDFGTEEALSPIDVCMRWGPGLASAREALHWLAPKVGVVLAARPAQPLRLVSPAVDDMPEPPPPPHPDEDGGAASSADRPSGTDAKALGGKKTRANQPPKGGGGGGPLPKLLKHYALIRGTDSVWDGEERTVMQVKNLRLLMGAPFVNSWLAHPERRLLLPEQICFEPGVDLTDASVNLFDGLPTEPVECTEADVKPMLDLLRHLCSLSAPTPEGCEAVVNQVLQWCALMVQQPGAKMRFALVFHGPQGAGKNMFWDNFKRIFGKYGKMVGQAELEDRFNGYMSGKLLLVANEVMTRAELFHGKNKLKWVITEDEIPIRGMHQETRWESNHCNLVFLSNENMPLALELDDRRHLVVYTPAAEDRDLYLRCADFIARDGAGKFMRYLQRVDLTDFNEYTKPLMTQAKRDLIALGMKPQQRFAAEWLEGYLDMPVRVCSVEQAFRVYQRWAEMNGIKWPGEQSMFTDIVHRFVMEQRPVDEKGVRGPQRLVKKMFQLKDPGTERRRALRCWVPQGCAPLNGVTEGEWAWEAVESFEPLVRRFGRMRSSEDGGER